MKFKMNQVVFDTENKEYVKITNGIDGLIGGVSREFEPTEGIAIRFVSMNHDTTPPQPVLGWTYRKVNASKLVECKENAWDCFDQFMRDDFAKTRQYLNVGRV